MWAQLARPPSPPLSKWQTEVGWVRDYNSSRWHSIEQASSRIQYTHVYTSIPIYTRIHMYTNVHMYTHVYQYTHVYKCTPMYTCIHMYVHKTTAVSAVHTSSIQVFNSAELVVTLLAVYVQYTSQPLTEACSTYCHFVLEQLLQHPVESDIVLCLLQCLEDGIDTAGVEESWADLLQLKEDLSGR